MRTPSTSDIVRLWELGNDKPEWYRGVLMLGPAFPDSELGQLARWSIGTRNIALFHIRRSLFGPVMTCRVTCPKCRAASEFTVTVDEICPHPSPELPLSPERTSEDYQVVTLGSQTIHLRRLDSADLVMAGAISASIASPDLLRRAIVHSTTNQHSAQVALPEGDYPIIADRLYEIDPQIEIDMVNTCALCRHEWNAPFDIVHYLWLEIAKLASRLLDDVHVLAREYGWREADILAMSPVRRRFYMEKVGE